MTQADVNRIEAQFALLRDLLRAIASQSDAHSGIMSVLEAALALTQAPAGYVLLLSDPRLLVARNISDQDVLPDETAKGLVATLTEPFDLHPQPADGSVLPKTPAIAIPVRLQKQSVGLMWLSLPSAAAPDDPLLEPLRMLIDLLKVLVMSARAAARHESLARNQSEFMRIVSHDLRSPLTSIQGFASMLEQGTVGEINERQSYFVEKILSGVTQMTSLVENIQDAGRYDLETGFYEMERHPCDLAEIVSRIIKNHLVPAEKQELSLSAVLADDVPIINADVNMLERAIINLVDNAIKYTPNGGRVEVVVRRRGDEVVVSVKDNGLGISQEHQKMLFERHFRIPRREHKKVKGSGLGLFIVRSVAQRHGGTAWVDSVEGQGSTFSFSIPLSEANALVSGTFDSAG